MLDKNLVITPQNDRVLVKSIERKNTTASGLVISAHAEEKIRTAFAEVIAVSETLKDTYEVDDIIFHNPNAGVDITLSGEKYILLTSMEILAKLSVAESAEEVDLDEVIRDNDI